MKKIISILLLGTALVLFVPPACGRKGADAPLTIVSTYPDPANNNDIPRDVSISVTFSTPVDESTVNFALKEGANDFPCAMSYGDTTAHFKPAELLAANTLYSATVGAGVKDLSGNGLLQDFVWYFKTGTSTGPPPGQGYTITASAGPNGSISPSGKVTVNQGAAQSFAITPNSGFRVAAVVVDGASAGAPASYTFTNVTANHTIAATFEASPIPATYTITASAGPNGSISPSGSISVNQGASQSFSMTANTGYRVSDVVVDGSSAGARTSYTFTNVTTSHSIKASFAANIYTITASAGAGGSISCSPTTVDYGSSSVCTISPDKDYRIADVVVDGSSVGHPSSYTFKSVTADHTIKASFRKH